MANRYDLDRWNYVEDQGWTWGHTWEDGTRVEYRTNGEGEGLWIRTSVGWNQLTGTCQFSLPRDRQAALRQLRREGLAADPLADN